MKQLFVVFFWCLVAISCKKEEEPTSSCSTCNYGGGVVPQLGFHTTSMVREPSRQIRQPIMQLIEPSPLIVRG
jgi:hypothetical protein